MIADLLLYFAGMLIVFALVGKGFSLNIRHNRVQSVVLEQSVKIHPGKPNKQQMKPQDHITIIVDGL